MCGAVPDRGQACWAKSGSPHRSPNPGLLFPGRQALKASVMSSAPWAESHRLRGHRGAPMWAPSESPSCRVQGWGPHMGWVFACRVSNSRSAWLSQSLEVLHRLAPTSRASASPALSRRRPRSPCGIHWSSLCVHRRWPPPADGPSPELAPAPPRMAPHWRTLLLGSLVPSVC